MVIIKTSIEDQKKLIVSLRIFVGLIWLGTVIRRLLTPDLGNFEERITQMAQGPALYPNQIMEIAITNWFLIFLVIISLEIISSISLLSGTLARGGALIASLNGFLIGLAGLGLGIIDLIIPWAMAAISLFLFFCTHPGLYFGVDDKLSKKNLPLWIKMLI
ncbi:MAG: hypothetical protein JSW11_07700 [Candidatus Heimdallarchaeota archaeon]|nr:MAG: hypothetical protein JSW11_07700 [Candidatus Heimdallarchaeota archaeon]